MYTLQGANILLTDDGDVKLGMDQSVYIHTHAHMHMHCTGTNMYLRTVRVKKTCPNLRGVQ